MAWRETSSEFGSADMEEDISSVWRSSITRRSRGRVRMSSILSVTESPEGGAIRGGSIVQEKPKSRNLSRPDTNKSMSSAQKTSSEKEQNRDNVGPSYLLPRLAQQERILMEMVVDGDVVTVQNFLDEYPHVNINCKDFQGLTPLSLAVRDGDLGMVEVLLTIPNIDVGDCALRAAQTGDPHVLLMLLEKQRRDRVGGEFVGSVGSTDFADGTTPLLVAAQGNHYDSIALLLARGHRLRRPHPPFCQCEVCAKEAISEDQLTVGRDRVALYRAWVSPAFLCHYSKDPILDAFLLCNDMQQWLLVTTGFHKDFCKMVHQTRKFAADLLGCCRSTSEVKMLLRQREGWCSSSQVMFPRLRMAVRLGQKEFVAHPNAQLALKSAWCGDWGDWRMRSTPAKFFTFLVRIPLLPWVALVTIFAPSTKIGRHYAAPVNKFLSDIASYVVFLAFVFVESNVNKRWQLRGPPKTGIEPVIILWVVGQIWSSTRMCYIEGPRRYFSMVWNWYDAITQLLFVTTFLFWMASALDISANGQRALERKYWHWLDPTLLAEGFFVLASIFAFGRLQLLCQFSIILGPMQVALGNMVKDIAKFCLLFVFTLLSFAWGLSRFYQYYDGMTQKDVSGATTTQARSFVSFPRTMMTLFWCIFCMSPLEVADVVIENMPSDDPNLSYNHHHFTQAVGYLCYAVFMILSVIVLLNMLVAAICNTYQRVTDNVDIEWTFGLTETILVYFSQTTLPPPLNLLPTVTSFANCCKWMALMCRRQDPQKKRVRWGSKEDDTPVDNSVNYTIILSQLAQRYFRRYEDYVYSPISLSPATADMENLRREVRLLRSSLLPGLEEAMTAAKNAEETVMVVMDAAMREDSPSVSLPSTPKSVTLSDISARNTSLPAFQVMAVHDIGNSKRNISSVASFPNCVPTNLSPKISNPVQSISSPVLNSGAYDPNRDGSTASPTLNLDLSSCSSVTDQDRYTESSIPIREVWVGASILNRDSATVSSVPTDQEDSPIQSKIRIETLPQDDPLLPQDAKPSTENLNLTSMEHKHSSMEQIRYSSESPGKKTQHSQTFPAYEISNTMDPGVIDESSRLPLQRHRRTRKSRMRSHRLPTKDYMAPNLSDEESCSDSTVATVPPTRRRVNPLRLRSCSRTLLTSHRTQLVAMREENESLAKIKVSSLDVTLCDSGCIHESNRNASNPEQGVNIHESKYEVSDIIYESDPDANQCDTHGKVCESHEIDFGSDPSHEGTSPIELDYCPIHNPTVYRIMEMEEGSNCCQQRP